jgi:hypothetical protein
VKKRVDRLHPLLRPDPKDGLAEAELVGRKNRNNGNSIDYNAYERYDPRWAAHRRGWRKRDKELTQ